MQNSTEQSAVAVAIDKNRYAILAIVLAGTVMSILDAMIVNIALPEITRYYGTGIASSQWVVTAYLITMTCLFLVFGKISEYTGKTRLFTAGAVVFTLASLACGLSGSLGQLIAFRIVQAVGAAMMFSIGAAIVYETFPGGERGRALGYSGAAAALGSILGPVLGGLIIDTLGWEYIFFLNLPIGVLLIAAAIRYLGAGEKRSGRLEMDWAGVATFVIATISLVMALGELSASAGMTVRVAAYTVVFIASSAVFLYNESRHRSPLLDLSLFQDWKFSLPILSMMLFYITHVIINTLGPFYFQGVLGYSSSAVGMQYMLMFAAMVIAAPASGWLYDRYHSGYQSAAGMVLIAAAFAALGISLLWRNPAAIAVSMAALGFGNGVFMTPNNVEAMSPVPGQKLGTASATASMVKNLAMSLGMSFVSVMLTFQISEPGFSGDVIKAAPGLLSEASANIVFIAGGICVLGAALSLMRNLKKRE